MNNIEDKNFINEMIKSMSEEDLKKIIDKLPKEHNKEKYYQYIKNIKEDK